MSTWELGLILAGVVAGIILVRWALRRSEAFPSTEVDIPLWDLEERAAVDLPLDLPTEPPSEPARLGYNDETMPAVQNPAPLRSARSVSNGTDRWNL